MSESLIQLYRSSVLCDVLTDTLDELCAEDKLKIDLAAKVLDNFDCSCLEALATRVDAKGSLQVRPCFHTCVATSAANCSGFRGVACQCAPAWTFCSSVCSLDAPLIVRSWGLSWQRIEASQHAPR